MPVTVLLVDHSGILRKAIRGLLQRHPSVQLVAEAENLSKAIELAKTLKPQVVVMDLHMPDRDAIKHPDVKTVFGPSKVLAISMSNDDEAFSLAETVGAIKLIDKMRLIDELVPAIEEAIASSGPPFRPA
jgi:DNA-binding NarL/FixJ family response regulator